MRPASRGPFRKRPCTERADAPRPARPPIEAYPQRYGEGGQRSRRGCSGPRMPGSYGNGPPGGRCAAVRIHRTASHERSPPPRLRSETRDRLRPIPRGPGRRNSFRRKSLPDTRREQPPGKEPPRLRTTKLPATLKSRVLFSVKISMGREEKPEDEKRWSICTIRDTRLRIPFGGHHPSPGERRMVEEKGIEPSTPTLRTWCSPN